MADYTVEEIKALVLDRINQIEGLKTTYTFIDADEAYEFATIECGFTHPESGDEDKDKKYRWLIQRMRRWYLGDLWERYILRFDVGDLAAQKIVENLKNICEKLDKDFEEAKASDDLGHLFATAADVFGSGASVIGTGLIEDRIGQPSEERT
jgi:hypothetical protein